MKKLILFAITLFVFSLNVNAGSTKTCEEPCDSSNPNYNEFNQFKTEYEKGIQENEVSSKGNIVIYGHSICNNGSCTYSYVGNTSDYKEVLKKSVKCIGGEKYITAQSVSQAKKDQADDNYTGDAYWNEDFEVTCTNSSTSNTLELSNTSNGTQNNLSNSNGDYSSADPGEQETHGVETYYIILGIAAIITYVISVVIKKQNLFKKI